MQTVDVYKKKKVAAKSYFFFVRCVAGAQLQLFLVSLAYVKRLIDFNILNKLGDFIFYIVFFIILNFVSVYISSNTTKTHNHIMCDFKIILLKSEF